MTQELAQKRTTASDKLPALTAKVPWHRFALAAVLILSAFLNLFRLTNEGYGNTYYSAAVKDMLTKLAKDLLNGTVKTNVSPAKP